MPSRARPSSVKRQRERDQKERRRQKEERRLQRKAAKAAGLDPLADTSGEGSGDDLAPDDAGPDGSAPDGSAPDDAAEPTAEGAPARPSSDLRTVSGPETC